MYFDNIDIEIRQNRLHFRHAGQDARIFTTSESTPEALTWRQIQDLTALSRDRSLIIGKRRARQTLKRWETEYGILHRATEPASFYMLEMRENGEFKPASTKALSSLSAATNGFVVFPQDAKFIHIELPHAIRTLFNPIITDHIDQAQRSELIKLIYQAFEYQLAPPFDPFDL